MRRWARLLCPCRRRSSSWHRKRTRVGADRVEHEQLVSRGRGPVRWVRVGAGSHAACFPVRYFAGDFPHSDHVGDVCGPSLITDDGPGALNGIDARGRDGPDTANSRLVVIAVIGSGPFAVRRGEEGAVDGWVVDVRVSRRNTRPPIATAAINDAPADRFIGRTDRSLGILEWIDNGILSLRE